MITIGCIIMCRQNVFLHDADQLLIVEYHATDNIIRIVHRLKKWTQVRYYIIL
jgi:hypothetical protein